MAQQIIFLHVFKNKQIKRDTGIWRKLTAGSLMGDFERLCAMAPRVRFKRIQASEIGTQGLHAEQVSD